jgi:signal transduction histidine kinase/CheY-like chemotaxis protein
MVHIPRELKARLWHKGDVDEPGPEPIAEKLGRIADPSALLENLFVHAPVPFSVFDAEGRCLVVNRAFLELFGTAPPADYDIFKDDVLAAAGHTAAVRRAFAGDTITLPAIWYDPRTLEQVKLEPANRVAIVITMFPLRDARQTVQHIGVCYKDVTADLELRDSAAERERTYLELVRLEAQSRQMHEAARLKGEFLANMSHELRTPLNAILGFAELIAEGVVVPGSAQHAEFMGHILGSGRQLLRLINDVLDLTKVEAGRMQFFPERVDLDQLVQEVCGVLKAANRQRELDIVTRCDPALTEIVIDPTRLKQVLFNYLSNAIKFSAARGHIEVRLLGENEREFRLEVADNGIGIAPEQRARLFVEFQQLDPGSAKQHSGTGVGLALTKRLVQALGGHVGVESQLGRGSTFYAILPRRAQLGRPRSVTPLPLRSQLPPAVPADGGAKVCAREPPPCVLVIDDDVASLRLMETALEQLGYQAIGAENAERGLSLAEQVKPECIVLDLMLPGVDGFEILAKLRADPHQKETPVIVWTMKDLSRAESESLASRAQAVLTKGGDDRCSLIAQLSTVLPKHPG